MCGAFLIDPMLIVQKTLSALEALESLERTVLHQVLNIPFFGTDRKQLFFIQGRERGSVF